MSATRRDLMASAAVASLAFAGSALAAEPADADQLARLLALERSLAAAYEGALERDAIDPALGKLLLGHEREHVRGLEQALGRRSPAQEDTPQLALDFANRRAFAHSALELERTTVDTYRDVLTTFHNDRLLQPLGSIMACGSQHEVALRRVLGEDLL